jgi:quinoprotein dehydrogenase-associated probable ABC transporter substrate-binding protein
MTQVYRLQAIQLIELLMRYRRLLVSLLLLSCSRAGSSSILRVCSDPNNLPFSNRKGEGLENHLAELIASELHARVQYTWWPQRRGFIRNTLAADSCDVVMGIPTGTERVLTTPPYYRSTYVFLSRKDRHLAIHSLDDPALRKLRIGVQLIGDDYNNTPPVHALSRRGITGNLVGYSVYGDYSQANPPARIVDAVVSKAVDIAIVWGPLAGYFAQRAGTELELVPVSPAFDPPGLQFTFPISLGVRPGDQALKQKLESVLDKRAGGIDSLLTVFGFPRVAKPDSAR